MAGKKGTARRGRRFGLRSYLLLVAHGTALSFLGLPLHDAHAGSDSLRKFGDAMQFTLPGLAIGSTLIAGGPDGSRWDKEGTYQSIKVVGATAIGTTAWKKIAGKLRPDFGSTSSFPSGHTSAAFSAAAFINTRYGWQWGLPAYALALVTGYSRWDADAHHLDDVLAGASLGVLTNWVFTTPQSDRFALMPMSVGDGAGFMLSYSSGGGGNDATEKRTNNSRPRFRYQLAAGPAYMEKNEISGPPDTGTTFDLDHFEKISDPITTAAGTFTFFLDDRHELDLFFWPFEARDRGRIANTISFGGQTFPAGTQITTAWRLYDARVLWRYNLTPKKPWDFRLGVGVYYQSVTMEMVGGDRAADVSDQIFLPYAHATLGYQFNAKWSLALAIDGVYANDNSMSDTVVYAQYRLNRHWDFSLGYEHYVRVIETDDLRNRVLYHVPYFALAYSW